MFRKLKIREPNATFQKVIALSIMTIVLKEYISQVQAPIVMSFIVPTNRQYYELAQKLLIMKGKKQIVHNHIVQVECTTSRLMKQLRLIYAS